MLKYLALTILFLAGCARYDHRIYLGVVNSYTCSNGECRVQLTTGDRYIIRGPVLVGDKLCRIMTYPNYYAICDRQVE